MSNRPKKEIAPEVMAKVTDELVQQVRDAARDGKITCPLLRRIGEDSGLGYKVAGAAAEVAGVKVHNCDLGCF